VKLSSHPGTRAAFALAPLPRLTVLAVSLALGCSKPAPAKSALSARDLPAQRVPGLQEALQAISAEGLRSDVEKLSSDEFLGRAPGTVGEQKTLTYLGERLQALGLEPGGGDGGYAQRVPLLGARTKAEASFREGGSTRDLYEPDDFVAQSRTGQANVALSNVQVMFVGYGVVAPEFNWDDYKGVDVHGKLLIMLVGDPPVPDPDDDEQLDPNTFGGRAMTYYGRWTYKYEMAAAKGAAGVLLVHDTKAAGYGYEVVKAGAQKELLMLDSQERRAQVEGWLAESAAKGIFAQSNLDFAALKAKAATREARPVGISSLATVRVHSTLRTFDSHNVIGVMTGSDPVLREEAIVVSAHWDHLGQDPNRAGDNIFNGAIDNASGVASLLAIAGALQKLPTKPRRSIVFLIPTAEEAGLLGAKYYAEWPVVALGKTVANLNMDCMNLWGKAKGIISIGLGTSSLDQILEAEATAQGRVVLPDPEPERGYFFRSDHLELMRKGVPALDFLHPGAQYLGPDAAKREALRAGYVAERYHKPSDQSGDDFDYTGAVDDARLLTRVLLDIANSDRKPTWTPGRGPTLSL
jgi:Zn-dependent M28 family amino/carboxypeptidase